MLLIDRSAPALMQGHFRFIAQVIAFWPDLDDFLLEPLLDPSMDLWAVAQGHRNARAARDAVPKFLHTANP